ncbi:separin protein, partial [Marasmius tenuissimus]
MPPSTATTTRRTATRQPPSTSRKATSVEQLAEQLATNLVVSKDVKGKQKAAPSMTPEEQRAHSMRNINSASQHLSSLFQSGWRQSQEKSAQKSSVSSDAIASASKATINLQTLRKLGSRDVDIERAAMSVLGKLVALELYESALQVMKDAHGRVCAIAGATLDGQAASERQTPALLTIPIPANLSTDITTLTLISTYLFNAIATLSYHSATPQRSKQNALTLDSFAETLSSSPTLLQWMPHFSTLPAKHLDPMLTKTYSLLTKMTPSGVKHNNPLLIFRVRMYAIKCLAYTSQGIIDNPASLWNQASKFAMSYAKAVAGGDSGAEGSVPAAFTELVRIAETRPDRASFVSGEGFINFCETWTTFANRSGDLQSLDRIGSLLQTASMPSSASKQTSNSALETKEDSVENKDILITSGTRLYTALAQLITILDKSVTAEVIPRIEECSTLIQSSPVVEIVTYSEETDKELQRLSGKVQRALEKSRRSALKSLEKSDSPTEQCANAIRRFIDVVVDILERALTLNPLPDFFTQLLDTSFTLAKTALTISDPRTYTTAYDHLDRAAVVLDAASKGQHPPELATYLRCTSGAFHNLAGTLYQAGRYGSAIPYLNESCRLGALAIDIPSRGKDEGEDVWKQLEEQLWRRWQLLALCYTKIGDRKAAFDSLQRCVEAFPYETSTFIDHANKHGLSSLFELNPSVKDLVGVVDRLTQMGTCELLSAARDISLRHIKVVHHCVRGALIERQLDGLETYRHKEGIAMVISELLKDALDTYREGSMPLRSMRIHVKALSFAYHNGVEHISSVGSIDDIAAKITDSADSEDLGNDKELVRFLVEYKASAQLWLGLHAHRTADPRRSSLISVYAEEACKTLQTWVSPSTQTTITPPSKPSRAAVGRQPKALKSRTKPPITPKPRGRA